MTAAYFPVEFRGDQFWFPRPDTEDHIRKMMERSGQFYEIRLLQFLCNRLDGSRWIVDCGANVGNHTVFFAGVLGRQVFAFEPISTNLEALNAAVERNALDSVTIVPKALGAENTTVSLGLAQGGNPGTYSIYADLQTEKVEMVTLDDYFTNTHQKGRCGIIKLDVEGHEAEVLKGAGKLIAQHRPMVVCECATEIAFEQIAACLRPFDYHAVRVFGKTPTVVFDRIERLDSEIDAVRQKIKQYEAA